MSNSQLCPHSLLNHSPSCPSLGPGNQKYGSKQPTTLSQASAADYGQPQAMEIYWTHIRERESRKGETAPARGHPPPTITPKYRCKHSLPNSPTAKHAHLGSLLPPTVRATAIHRITVNQFLIKRPEEGYSGTRKLICLPPNYTVDSVKVTPTITLGFPNQECFGTVWLFCESVVACLIHSSLTDFHFTLGKKWTDTTVTTHSDEPKWAIF